MEALLQPLRHLSDALSWFVRARELRLAYVAAGPELRSAVLSIARLKEYHADNTSPFVELDTAFTSAEAWLEALDTLRAQHESRRARMLEQGDSLPALPERPAHAESLAAFEAQLEQLLDARPRGTEGLVVILAPRRIDEPGAFCEQLTALVDSKSLAAVRWIVVAPSPLSLELSSRHDCAMVIECHLDQDAVEREMDALLDAAVNASPALSGAPRAGAAWPREVTPPPRPDRPAGDEDSIDAALRKEGVTLPIAKRAGVELGRAVVGGVQAMRRHEPQVAVELQARARDLCIEAQRPAEAALMELVLGAYQVAADDEKAAQKTYEAATARAVANGLHALGAQVELALGTLHLRRGDRDAASRAYGRAAELAKAGGFEADSIEALRAGLQAGAT